MSQDTYQALVVGVPAVGGVSEKGGSAITVAEAVVKAEASASAVRDAPLHHPVAPLYHPVPYPEEKS